MIEAETERQSAKTAGTIVTDKLYMENTLLRVSGALFCHDAKRAPTRTNEIELNRGVADKHITIRPDPRLGQPGPLAHKVFVALIKKHSGYGRPIPREISFTKREIMRMIGRREWGGRDSEQLSRALHEIHYTFIKAQFKGDGGKLIEHSFNIFPEIWIERREFASDPIEACTITLAEPILASLREDHFTCLNHALMAQLGTIGQALYMRLFFHFANLYTGRNAKGLAVRDVQRNPFHEEEGRHCCNGARSSAPATRKPVGSNLHSHTSNFLRVSTFVFPVVRPISRLPARAGSLASGIGNGVCRPAHGKTAWTVFSADDSC